MEMKCVLMIFHMFMSLMLTNNVQGIDIKNLPCYKSRSCYPRSTRKGTFNQYRGITENIQKNDTPGLTAYFKTKNDEDRIGLASLQMKWRKTVQDLLTLAASDAAQYRSFTSAINALQSPSSLDEFQDTDRPKDEYYVETTEDLPGNTKNIVESRLWNILLKERV